MKIKAKTRRNEIVTIIAFVNDGYHTYAVVIGNNGRLEEYPIEELTVEELNDG